MFRGRNSCREHADERPLCPYACLISTRTERIFVKFSIGNLQQKMERIYLWEDTTATVREAHFEVYQFRHRNSSSYETLVRYQNMPPD